MINNIFLNIKDIYTQIEQGYITPEEACEKYSYLSEEELENTREIQPCSHFKHWNQPVKLIRKCRMCGRTFEDKFTNTPSNMLSLIQYIRQGQLTVEDLKNSQYNLLPEDISLLGSIRVCEHPESAIKECKSCRGQKFNRCENCGREFRIEEP
jgi:hypothetical protein